MSSTEPVPSTEIPSGAFLTKLGRNLWWREALGGCTGAAAMEAKVPETVKDKN